MVHIFMNSIMLFIRFIKKWQTKMFLILLAISLARKLSRSLLNKIKTDLVPLICRYELSLCEIGNIVEN